MYKAERQNRIREILRESHQIDVSDLSTLLSVSEATIRSDFEELEQEGFLTRYHGGAAISETQQQTSGYPFALPGENAAKELIGTIAAHLVEDSDAIYLGSGTTTAYIAAALASRHGDVINVVTTNFLVANALCGCPSVRLHFLGGQVAPDGLFTIPDNFEELLTNLYFDKMFFSIDGIDPVAGYTLSDPAVQDQILTAARHSRSIIMAADHSKFGYRSFKKVGDLDFAGTVITNTDVPEKFLEFYKAHHVQIFNHLTL